jgi:hypothetical protein
MHQNKFHTEKIQQLTIKYQASTKGGPALTAEEQKLADHLKILYKFANKGIKGRGKKEPSESKVAATVTTGPTQEMTRSDDEEEQQQPPIESRGFTGGGEQLLPLPVSKPLLSSSTAAYIGWPTRTDDVFIGNQGGGGGNAGVVQSNSFLGIPGDFASSSSSAGGLGGYAFGNMG